MMEIKYDVGKKVIVLSNQVKRSLDRAAEDSGITGVQARVLGILAEAQKNNGDVFQKDIEEKLQIRRSSVTGILQLMEKKGLISRESVPYDARLKKIGITKEAKKLGDHLHENIYIFEQNLIKGISNKDLETFLSVINILSRNING
ncbi:MarR family winged helix-turn-helix transcriptional regulator [Acetobacterium tundrae]|uniref:MarR family transcriptional regulator n=2 Tax=Acetobacterium tundrae TaxID=132932 RepID=A0ABR6WFX6_9FIRM|nr:MarR family transcriptional regulator [Acetobacterium tundrae]MBC3795441.1 MarR family transcriptional regulator [Acetobacterium tundrae]